MLALILLKLFNDFITRNLADDLVTLVVLGLVAYKDFCCIVVKHGDWQLR